MIMVREIDERAFDNRVEFDRGRVNRRFTEEWSRSSFINIEKLPDMMQSVLEARKSMLKYIEALHDKIDWILEKNKCCNMPSCLRAGCTSDHK